MALVTIQRSPSPSTDPDLDADSLEDVCDGRSQLRKRSKTSKEKLRKIFSSMRFLSKLRPCLSESYFTIKGAALILPHTECTKKTTKKNHGGEIQSHLQAMLNFLRPEDTIKIAVRLEDTCQFQRYIALVSTKGRQDTEEAVVLGIDCTSTSASIGLVLPMWMGLRIKLGGDGGFSLCTDELSYLFKPVSVQAMWSAIQSLYKALRIAEDMSYIPEGLTHTWVGYYKSRADSRDSSRVCQWSVEGVEIFAPSSLSIKASESESESLKLAISNTLKEVMMDYDLDEATSVMLRKAVEQKMGMSLAEYKSYFDEEVMRIVGQMDKPSEILDFLYLGSEWNASNLDELLEKGIGYILNVTKEIDNFFEGKFQYYNVRVYDLDESDLLKHWDKTYKFISKAKDHKSKVLVHCKMGVSRSASTVMAFLMKDLRMTVDQAFQFVKERRACVHPNSGFMEQLHTYEGILSASNKRDIFRCKSEQNLADDGSKDEAEPLQGDFLGDSLFRMMSYPDWHSTSMSQACDEQYIYSVNKDLEAAESRSADSTEESASDLPCSAPETTAVSCAPQAPTIAKAAPVFIIRPSLGSSAVDKEMSQERGACSEAESITALSSSEGSISLQLRTCASALASRIKPDSSWIKSDTVELGKCDACGEVLPFIDALSGDDACNSAPPPHTCASSIAEPPKALSQYEETHLLPDTSEESKVTPNTTALPYSSFANSHLSNLPPEKSKYSSDVHFYIGSIHNPLDIKPMVTASSDILKAQGTTISNIVLGSKKHSYATLAGDNVTSQDDPSSLKLIPSEEIIPHSAAGQRLEEPVETMSRHADAALDKPESSPKVEDKEATARTITKTPRSKIELGVRQYFIPEKIPWKLGKVRKMQEDINKTGHISQDEDNDEDGGEKTLTELSEVQETHDESTLLEQISEHRPTTSLCQSQSCVELCSSQEPDSAQLSVYQREDIPLVPGTVSRLRTWLEIDDKQGVLCGEGDQEVATTARPVDRTSSLKLERGTPRSRYTDNRRFTTGHIMYPDKSFLDLQSIAVSSDLNSRSTVALSSGQIEERNEDIDIQSEDPPFEAGLVRKHKMVLENRLETDNVQPKTVMKSASLSNIKSSLASYSAVPSLAPIVPTPCGTQNAETMQSDFQLSCTSRPREQVARDSFDSDILVQESASLSLVNSNPPQCDSTESQPCANMVQYYVRKIEEQGVASPEKQGVASPQIEKQEVTSPQIEKQGVVSPQIEKEALASFVSDIDAIKVVSPTKEEAFKVKYLSEGEAMNRVLLASSLNAAVHAKHTKQSDGMLPPSRSLHETSGDLASTATNVQSESNIRLNHSQNFIKSSDSGKSCRLALSLKFDSSTCLLPQVSSPVLEEVGKISLSSPMNDVQEQFLVPAEIRRPESSTSSRSSGHGLVHEPLEPSVVRHLVGRFENRSPESERVSSDSSHDLMWKPKDGHEVSIPSQSASSRSQKEENLMQSHPEDTIKQSAASSNQSFYRPVDTSGLHQCSSSGASADLYASSSANIFPASPRLPLHRQCVSLDSASSSVDMSMKNSLRCDIPVELRELHSDSSGGKEQSAGLSDTSSKRPGPVPFTRSSESSGMAVWKPVLGPHSASFAEHKSSFSDMQQMTKEGTADDDVSLRQVSDEGRKMRRLQRNSHPHTKLPEPSFGKGPFYSSM